MTGIASLSAIQIKVYALLRQKAGEIVTYEELEAGLSCNVSRSQLASAMCRLRSCGLRIRCVSGRGYYLKPTKAKEVPIFEIQPDDYDVQSYATDIQDAIHGAMRNHAETVGLEPQMAIMGVAIGSILGQLPYQERQYYLKILITNLRKAPQLSETVNLQ